MAGIVEIAEYPEEIYRLEESDPVQGGENGVDNLPHKQLAGRTGWLRRQVGLLQDAERDLVDRVSVLEGGSATAMSRAVRLDWEYGAHRFHAELFSEGWSLLEPLTTAIIATVAGDDSVDIGDTSWLRVGDDYVLSEDGLSEVVTVQRVLTAHRFQATAALRHTFGALGRCAKTSFAVGSGSAVSRGAGVYLSVPVQLGGGEKAQRSCVVRLGAGDGVLALSVRDATDSAWRPVPWAWRRFPEEGATDTEFLFEAQGSVSVKLEVTGQGDVSVQSIVILGEPTFLGGEHHAPDAPVNVSPAAAALSVQETPTLWVAGYASPVQSEQQALQVQIVEGAATGFSAPLYEAQVVAGLSCAIPAGVLQEGSAYKWRARVQDAEGAWSGWSAETAFNTAHTFSYIETPVNLLPTNGGEAAAAQTLAAGLYAVRGGFAGTHTGSQWQIRESSGSYDDPVWDSGAASDLTSARVPLSLEFGAPMYFWRVRYLSEGGAASEWSQETRFRSGVDLTLASFIAASRHATAALAAHQAKLTRLALDNLRRTKR